MCENKKFCMFDFEEIAKTFLNHAFRLIKLNGLKEFQKTPTILVRVFFAP